MPSTTHLIDPIWPLGSIHLIAGPTGAGKSRWLIETMLRTERNEVIMGFQSYAHPWLYVSADRQQSEVWRTVDALGIPRSRIPLISAFAPLKSPAEVFDAAAATGVEVIVWEGFGSYAGDHAGSNAVRHWLSSMTWALRNCTPHPLTIVGVMEQPKMKPRDRYTNPRQRISGPAAWGHSSDTIVLVEYSDVECAGDGRELIVCSHHAPTAELRGDLADGRLVVS